MHHSSLGFQSGVGWGRCGEDGKRQRISWKGFPGGIGHQLWRKRGLEFTVLFLEEGPNWAGQRGKSSNRLAQLNRDNLTPSELWPQPKPSPTSGRPPFSRADMRLVSHGMSWGRGVERQRSRKYIRVLEGHPSSPNSSSTPKLPAGSLMRGSVGKGSATGLHSWSPSAGIWDCRGERLSGLDSAPYLDYGMTTRGSFDSTSAALCFIVGPVVGSWLHLNPQFQLLILAGQRPVQRG